MSNPDRDWKSAGEEALTTALKRAGDLATDCGDMKQLDSIIKTLGEIVGAGLVLGGKSGGASGTAGSDDDDDET